MSKVIQIPRDENYNLINQKDVKSVGEMSLLQIMKEITFLLNEFETVAGKFDAQLETNNSKIAGLSAIGAQHQMKKANEQLKKIEEVEKEQSKANFWGKVIRDVGIAASITAGVILCAMGMPMAAIIVAAVGIAASTGLMLKARNELSKGFEIMGFPPAVSDLLADAFLAVIVIGGTFGLAGVGGAEVAGEVAAETAAETATEATTEATTEVASETTEEVTEEESQSLIDKAKELIGKVSEKTRTRIGATLVNQSQLVGGLNVAKDIVDALPGSDKKKGKLMMIFEIIQTVEMILTALVGGGAMSTATTSTLAGEAGEETSQLMKGVMNLKNFLQDNSEALMKFQALLNGGIGAGSATIQITAGINKLHVAEAREKLAGYQEIQTLVQDNVTTADDGIKSAGQAAKSDATYVSELNEIARHLTDVMGTVAQLTA